MKKRLLTLSLLLLATPFFTVQAQTLPGQNPVIEARVVDLLSKMTLEEKIGQMMQIDVLRLMGDPSNEWDRGPLEPTWTKTVLDTYQVGSILSGGGAAPLPNTPANWAAMTAKLGAYTLEHSRLKIPLIYGIDAVHGHNNVQGATFYPHQIGLGATFDPVLVSELAKQTALAVRSTGIAWNFAPVADLGRDPRWGRFYETFGEDPTLTSSLVSAHVKGQLEGGGIATVKHFYGYGSSQNGVDRADTVLEDATLRTYDLPAYRAAIQAGAQTVMVNSGSVRGVPVHASSDILNKLLRQELGFGGLVISDWEDVLKLSNGYRFVPNYKEGIKAAVNAGVDVAMIPHDAATYAKLLSELVGEGAVSKSRIDEAAGRMLRLKLEAGLFGPQKANPSLENLKTPELARRAALESMTLLENTKNVLPFKTGLKKLTVAGDSANSVERLLGGWSIGWQGLGGESVSGVSTVWEALRAQVPKTTQLAYAEDSSALKKEAASSDAVLLILGEPPYAEGKGDVARPSLTPEQIGLFEAARASKKPVVVVLVAGRPLILPPQKPDALMMAYLPGSEGASAIVQALWGKSNPSGRLPFSYPRALEQLPMNYNRPSSVAYAPLYPFGAGLSYTTFGYGKLEATQSGTKVKVSLEVKNTGVLEGAEVVQVFASHGGPQRQLATFARVFLQPGASQSVALEFPSSNLLTLSTDPAAKGMERKFVLSVGTQKVDLALEGP